MNASRFVVLHDSNFDLQVLARAGVSVVDFWSTSCIPCRQMTRLLQQLAGEIPPDVMIGQVDADSNPALVARYGVRALPTLLFFKDGALVETRTGIDRRQVLRKAIESHA
ncbi:MAG: thioredoxin family protein [Betaproteobacteria bacterium]|nr:thioredoxin family protein [Betaproteobacteria bacterium]